MSARAPAALRRRAHSACPALTASVRAVVVPSRRCTACTSAEASISLVAHSAWPACAADISGVKPSACPPSTAAPPSSSAVTHWARPYQAAHVRADQPSDAPRRLGSAWRTRSSSTTLRCPLHAARLSTLRPPRRACSTESVPTPPAPPLAPLPRASSNSTVSGWPCCTALTRALAVSVAPAESSSATTPVWPCAAATLSAVCAPHVPRARALGDAPASSSSVRAQSTAPAAQLLLASRSAASQAALLADLSVVAVPIARKRCNRRLTHAAWPPAAAGGSALSSTGRPVPTSSAACSAIASPSVAARSSSSLGGNADVLARSSPAFSAREMSEARVWRSARRSTPIALSATKQRGRPACASTAARASTSAPAGSRRASEAAVSACGNTRGVRARSSPRASGLRLSIGASVGNIVPVQQD